MLTCCVLLWLLWRTDCTLCTHRTVRQEPVHTSFQ